MPPQPERHDRTLEFHAERHLGFAVLTLVEVNRDLEGLDVALLRETVGKESESILSLSNALEI